MYKKEYEQILEVRDEDWRKKHDYKNLKDLNYQVDKINKADKADETEKEDKNKHETDQELTPWIESKDEFNKLKKPILSVKNDKLTTSTKNINMISAI